MEKRKVADVEVTMRKRNCDREDQKGGELFKRIKYSREEKKGGYVIDKRESEDKATSRRKL